MNVPSMNALVELLLVLAVKLPITVYRSPPGNARDPGFRISDAGYSMFRYPQENLLHHVFCVRMIANHGIGDAKDQSRVLPNQRFDLRSHCICRHAARLLMSEFEDNRTGHVSLKATHATSHE